MSDLLKTLLEPCVALIEIEPLLKAKQIALRESSVYDQKRSTLWSDGSHRNTGGSIAIVWRNNSTEDGWDYQMFLLDKMISSNTLKFFAFYKAVQFATQECR